MSWELELKQEPLKVWMRRTLYPWQLHFIAPWCQRPCPALRRNHWRRRSRRLVAGEPRGGMRWRRRVRGGRGPAAATEGRRRRGPRGRGKRRMACGAAPLQKLDRLFTFTLLSETNSGCVCSFDQCASWYQVPTMVVLLGFWIPKETV